MASFICNQAGINVRDNFYWMNFLVTNGTDAWPIINFLLWFWTIVKASLFCCAFEVIVTIVIVDSLIGDHFALQPPMSLLLASADIIADT